MARTLERVIALRPDRIACYNYAHLPERFPSQRSIDRMTLPEPEEKLLLAQMISATLRDAGYVFIGMDHYVLPDDELAVAQQDGRLQRNFQGYSLRIAEDLLGLGVSAISQIGDFYLQNARALDEYTALTEAGKLPITRGYTVKQEDRLRRHVIMSLICELALDVSECEAEYGIDFRRHFSDALAGLADCFADGLLRWESDRLQVTEKGRQFLRNICMPFDEYLTPSQPNDSPRFSATV